MAIPQTQIAAVLPPSGANATSRLQIINDRSIPVPTEGEVLVKLEYSGVCHSDVHSVRGETPMLTDVAGHEGVGKVVKAGIAMYSSIMKTKTRPEDWIVLPGAGGGLGHIGEKKKQLCLSLGAHAFLDYKTDDVEREVKALTSGLGLTIVGNSAGTAKEMEELMEMAVKGDVTAHIECFEFDCIDDVLQRLGRSEIEGRAVVRIPE
ncbi:hypothetical protein AtubIFM56815_010122 [Aspergillus tubingensis]|uniref:Alcohol dehydrogenase-like N-terminal domain-containing protein n=1 Tax=Aspergillus tubingensis TaxID=5068 RepID=A0A9W6ENU6_ASPTU|nr:hypothetical protein AtubIFM56815_010122 [Aspergillus tubingensis]